MDVTPSGHSHARGLPSPERGPRGTAPHGHRPRVERAADMAHGERLSEGSALAPSMPASPRPSSAVPRGTSLRRSLCCSTWNSCTYSSHPAAPQVRSGRANRPLAHTLAAELVRLRGHRPARAAAGAFRAAPGSDRAVRNDKHRPAGTAVAPLRHGGGFTAEPDAKAARHGTSPVRLAPGDRRSACDCAPRLRPPPASPSARGHTESLERSGVDGRPDLGPWATCRPPGSESVAASDARSRPATTLPPAGNW